MRNKKVAIVLNTSWNIFNFRRNLARAIKEEGYDVTVIAPYDSYSDKLKEEFEYHDVYINNKGTNPFQDFITFLRFFLLYIKIRPDVALNYTIKPNIYGTLAGSLLGVKSINNISGLGTLFIKKNLATRVAISLYRWSQGKASKIFFQNKEDLNLFVKERMVKPELCDLLPGSGVDTKRFIPCEKEGGAGVFTFLFMGRVLKDKGVEELIEAAKIIHTKYDNVRVNIIGFLDVKNKTAISKEQMMRWVEEGVVNYLGVSDEIEEVIKEADCVVLPSYREGLPRTLLEAASMAKPIITCDTQGCRDVVSHEINGFLCEVANAEDLANQMERMLCLSKEERETMGKMGRKKMVKEFDEALVIEKYLNTIEEVLSKNKMVEGKKAKIT